MNEEEGEEDDAGPSPSASPQALQKRALGGFVLPQEAQDPGVRWSGMIAS